MLRSKNAAGPSANQNTARQWLRRNNREIAAPFLHVVVQRGHGLMEEELIAAAKVYPSMYEGMKKLILGLEILSNLGHRGSN